MDHSNRSQGRQSSRRSLYLEKPMSIHPAATRQSAVGWRTPAVIAICGCLVSLVAFGPRSALGFFLTPLSQANGWGRDVFAVALAVQNLLWGAALPFAGAIADRLGASRVIMVGAILYALGLAGMAYSPTVGLLNLTAGVLIGLGLSGASPLLVIGAFGKLLPERYRALSFGAATAAGSFGQFLFSPLAVALIGVFDWQQALVIMALLLLVFVLPSSLALSSPPTTTTAASSAGPQSFTQALKEALRDRKSVV